MSPSKKKQVDTLLKEAYGVAVRLEDLFNSLSNAKHRAKALDKIAELKRAILSGDLLTINCQQNLLSIKQDVYAIKVEAESLDNTLDVDTCKKIMVLLS